MGLPAFLSPSAPVPAGDDAPPALSVEADRACSAWWDAARAAWAQQPSEGSAVEADALRATLGLLLELSRALADRPQANFRALVHEGLRRVMREQRATAEDDRSFALRQLEVALEHYGVAVETLTGGANLDAVFAEAVSSPQQLPVEMPPEIRPLYRAHGALLMAFEAMGTGSASEFRYWTRQAVERWRGVVAALPVLTALMRGARAQARARGAWESWTEEDRSVERDAWKALR